MTQRQKAAERIEVPSIEEQVAQLEAAGWIKIRSRLWKAPVGGYFPGPHGAWVAMTRRSERDKQEDE